MAGGLHPHLDILGPDFEIPGPQHKTLTGLAAHSDVPVFPHRCQGLLLEVHQREQVVEKPLRAEHQLIFFPLEAQL